MGQGFFGLAQKASQTADRVERWVPSGGVKDRGDWPDGYLSVGGEPAKFHYGQMRAYMSERRYIAMIAGTQGGKTSFVPWWLWKEVRLRGGGDYLAVTSSYDLFKLKMLPAMRECFEGILGIGRYWAGDKIIELAHPTEGFLARRASDEMWGRVLLRSAESASGLESATALAAVLDEAGQEKFRVGAWRAIRRRLALHRGRVLITTTLYTLGWLDREVMAPAEESGTLERYKAGQGELTVIESEPADTTLIQFDSVVNPDYPMEEFEEARDRLPDDEFEMQYRGRIGKIRTLVYDCFDVRRDVVREFEIPGNWKRWVGLDFGGTNTVGVYFAEDPKTGVMYGYRLYHGGKQSVSEHVREILAGEEQELMCFGGHWSEGQWRKEFMMAGLYVHEPPQVGLEPGILRVYAAKKRGLIKYFEALWPIVDENLRYKRRVDEEGRVLEEIVMKKSFHYLDAERYVISYVKSTAASLKPGVVRYA